MRLKKYNSMEEALAESRMVSLNHRGGVEIFGIPDRFKLLILLGTKYASKVDSVFSKTDLNDVKKIDMFPSEWVKLAHNFQLSIKCTEYSYDNADRVFLGLLNYGIERRRHLTEIIFQQLLTANYYSITEDSQRTTLSYFCALLRACSEVLYCDNHTSCGDLFGPIIENNITWITKSYKNLSSRLLYGEECPVFDFKEIEIYLGYDFFIGNFDMIGNLTTFKKCNENIKKYFIHI